MEKKLSVDISAHSWFVRRVFVISHVGSFHEELRLCLEKSW